MMGSGKKGGKDKMDEVDQEKDTQMLSHKFSEHEQKQDKKDKHKKKKTKQKLAKKKKKDKGETHIHHVAIDFG